jgi:hypothetical protein
MLMKKNVSTVEGIEHTLLLLRMECHIQNGITILSKKIVGSAEGVIEIFYITRPFPLSKSVEVFGYKGIQVETPLTMYMYIYSTTIHIHRYIV